MKAIIACKGFVHTGLGHLFRSKKFAHALIDRGYDVILIAIVDDGLQAIFADIKCEVRYLSNDSEVLQVAADECPDLLVFDMLQFDVDSYQSCKDNSRYVVSISPIFNCADYLDAIFVRAPVDNISSSVEVICGLEYTVFSEYVRRIDDHVYKNTLEKDSLSVALCMGGTDSPNKVYNVLSKLIKEVKEECLFWVLLGEGYEHSYDELVKLSKTTDSNHEVILAKTNKSMWDILDRSSIGIFAGGLTLLESVYAGLPSINIFECRDHEKVAAKEIFELGAAINCGVIEEDSISKASKYINHFCQKRGELFQMKDACKKLIDGEGAFRIIDQIEQRLKPR